MSKQRALKEIAVVNRKIKEGHLALPAPGNNNQMGAVAAAALELKVPIKSLRHRIGTPTNPGTWKRLHGIEPDWNRKTPQEQKAAADKEKFHEYELGIKHAEPSFTGGPVIELTSRPDNTFLFGAAGDLHAASKYTRWDVREDLYRTFIDEGAQCNFDTGNWIDGECRFNTYDLEAHGIDEQCRLLARQHPKGLKTYAVWGDDHEGWYVQRLGIDCGMYAESVMRAAGHDWTNLGFMEAHVVLKNYNSGAAVDMAVVHPGGGSAYALSYAIQKIIESLEGGEKPAVGLYGHYHKMWSGLIRNVWCVQTGTQQDQTPFMRKKRLEAHVGGSLIKLRQDPRTGAIVSMQAELIRYFNKGFHSGTGRWSRHGKVVQVPRRKNQT